MEPASTALILVATAALLLLAAGATRLSGRFGVPSLLFFLALGVLVGASPWEAGPLARPEAAFRLGTMALVLILFDGGLSTPVRAVRSVALPASLLATVGVLLTALAVALVAMLLGLPPSLALLVGAIVSSTDAAAVFAALRASHTRLRERVGLTLELESGLNDPMAVFLTIATTEAVLSPEALGPGLLLSLLVQLGVGLAAGLVGGVLGRWLLAGASLPSSGLYPVMTVAIAFGVFGLATLSGGSGFLAVYVAAIYLTAGRLPYRASLARVHDALAWLAQILMFVVLGILVVPAELPAQLATGVALALVLALVARPLSVLACLASFRYPAREVAFIALTGLRGAVPIILATYPVIRGVPGSRSLLDLVFVMVVVNSLFPGAAVAWLAGALGMRRPSPPPPPAGLEMNSLADYDGDFVSYFVSRASAASKAKVRDLPLPEGSLVTLIVREHDILAPRGETVIEPGDHVYVFSKTADRSFVDLLFGSPEE